MKFKKSLGQNFLIDKNVIKKIVKIGNLNSKSLVLEIGPGLGNLTDEILKYKPKKVYAVEKDYDLFKKLNEKYKDNKNIKIFNHDAFDFQEESLLEKNLVVYGNLPYNISTKLLVKWIMTKKWLPWFKCLILMFQKEVGDRIIAKKNSKSYGRIAILTNLRLNFKKKFNVSKNCFFPKPKIDSSVIEFFPKINVNYKNLNPKKLEFVTRYFFSNRRKMIRKNYYKIFKNDKIKNKLRLNLNLRPENLDPEIYYKLSEMLNLAK